MTRRMCPQHLYSPLLSLLAAIGSSMAARQRRCAPPPHRFLSWREGRAAAEAEAFSLLFLPLAADTLWPPAARSLLESC